MGAATGGIVMKFQFGTNWAPIHASLAMFWQHARSRGFVRILPGIGRVGLVLFGWDRIERWRFSRPLGRCLVSA